MPRGYPDTITCKNCGTGLPAEFSYCYQCGEPLYKMPKPKKELVQVMNPITKRYVLIDKSQGKILKHARTNKPYKNVRIITEND